MTSCMAGYSSTPSHKAASRSFKLSTSCAKPRFFGEKLGTRGATWVCLRRGVTRRQRALAPKGVAALQCNVLQGVRLLAVNKLCPYTRVRPGAVYAGALSEARGRGQRP